MKSCSKETHEKIKADPVRWENETVKIATTSDIDDYGKPMTLDWRNCKICESTLAISIYDEPDIESERNGCHEVQANCC